MTPDLLVLDVPDSPIEGFGRHVAGGHEGYFTLVASNDAQDARLFAVVGLPVGTFDEVVGLYATTNRLPDRPAWLPAVAPHDPRVCETIAALIEATRSRIPVEGVLVRARQVGEPLTVRRVGPADRARLDALLSQRRADAIEGWP